mmetsp:Transcript_27559/g.38772  ORF Transcript_27559/g.38772 Transcript_27559/m.38772 type:complete len:229 (-) Transcript_27559:187-873(-)
MALYTAKWSDWLMRLAISRWCPFCDIASRQYISKALSLLDADRSISNFLQRSESIMSSKKVTSFLERFKIFSPPSFVNRSLASLFIVSWTVLRTLSAALDPFNCAAFELESDDAELFRSTIHNPSKPHIADCPLNPSIRDFMAFSAPAFPPSCVTSSPTLPRTFGSRMASGAARALVASSNFLTTGSISSSGSSSSGSSSFGSSCSSISMGLGVSVGDLGCSDTVGWS